MTKETCKIAVVPDDAQEGRMFPRPSLFYRLVMLLFVIVFIAVFMYIFTFDMSSTTDFTEYKMKTQSSSMIVITVSGHEVNHHGGTIQNGFNSTSGENLSEFPEMIMKKLVRNSFVHMEDNNEFIQGVKSSMVEVNVHNFAYIHNPSTICQRNVVFLVYIHSSPENIKKRQAVRQTWGHPKLLSLYNATLMFILGRSFNPNIQSLINMEAAQYGDILQENFVDSYRNLTHKGLAGLKWAGTFCTNSNFLLKTDDDILLDIVSFMENFYTKILPSRGEGTKLVLCNVWTRMRVIREPKSKWYVSRQEFPHDYFPPYCSGSAYLLSSDLVTALYGMALQTPFFWVDDCYVTGMLVNKLKIQHTRLNSAYLLNYNVAEERLKNDSKELMIFHVKKLSLFLKLWPVIMQRHKGMDKYLMPVTMLLWNKKQNYPAFNASDSFVRTNHEEMKSND